ncbi:hypothetical protein MTO96_006386 [Rhipicephalus appendiculatus]
MVTGVWPSGQRPSGPSHQRFTLRIQAATNGDRPCAFKDNGDERRQACSRKGQRPAEKVTTGSPSGSGLRRMADPGCDNGDRWAAFRTAAQWTKSPTVRPQDPGCCEQRDRRAAFRTAAQWTNSPPVRPQDPGCCEQICAWPLGQRPSGPSHLLFALRIQAAMKGDGHAALTTAAQRTKLPSLRPQHPRCENGDEHAAFWTAAQPD